MLITICEAAAAILCYGFALFWGWGVVEILTAHCSVLVGNRGGVGMAPYRPFMSGDLHHVALELQGANVRGAGALLFNCVSSLKQCSGGISSFLLDDLPGLTVDEHTRNGKLLFTPFR